MKNKFELILSIICLVVSGFIIQISRQVYGSDAYILAIMGFFFMYSFWMMFIIFRNYFRDKQNIDKEFLYEHKKLRELIKKNYKPSPLACYGCGTKATHVENFRPGKWRYVCKEHRTIGGPLIKH